MTAAEPNRRARPWFVGAWSGAFALALGRPAFAQGGLGMIDPPAPPSLPAPPLWERFLLENPWPLALLLAALGIAAAAALRHRIPAPRTAAIAVGLFALAAGVLLLARVVTTAGERVTEATYGLVAAAARPDAGSIGRMLDPDVSLFPPGGGPALDRAQIISRVENDLGGRWRLREWAILECQASVSGEVARTQVKVRATPESVGFPNISWWRLGWRRDASGAWRAISIEPVSVTGEVERELR